MNMCIIGERTMKKLFNYIFGDTASKWRAAKVAEWILQKHTLDNILPPSVTIDDLFLFVEINTGQDLTDKEKKLVLNLLMCDPRVGITFRL
jgi:hypothetical protein